MWSCIHLYVDSIYIYIYKIFSRQTCIQNICLYMKLYAEYKVYAELCMNVKQLEFACSLDNFALAQPGHYPYAIVVWVLLFYVAEVLFESASPHDKCQMYKHWLYPPRACLGGTVLFHLNHTAWPL